jgi:hypothetical protein
MEMYALAATKEMGIGGFPGHLSCTFSQVAVGTRWPEEGHRLLASTNYCKTYLLQDHQRTSAAPSRLMLLTTEDIFIEPLRDSNRRTTNKQPCFNAHYGAILYVKASTRLLFPPLIIWYNKPPSPKISLGNQLRQLLDRPLLLHCLQFSHHGFCFDRTAETLTLEDTIYYLVFITLLREEFLH